ncbi:MAG: HAD family hydrolase [Proteobacteria bacterium]|nr:HAD family hydrolase [Pseudomonadota bacterium]
MPSPNPASDGYSMLRNARTFLFDFDGTLAPNLDLPDMRRRVLALTDTYGVPAAVYQGQYIVEVIIHAGAWLSQRDRKTAEEYVLQAHTLILNIELDAAARTQPFAHTRSVLQDLKELGCQNVIVTRNCAEAIQMVFPDMLDYVAAALPRGAVEWLKPDPRHLSEALVRINADPASAVMVGDGAMDMTCGKKLNLYCVGVLTGSSDRIRLQDAGADLVLDDISALVALVGEERQR